MILEKIAGWAESISSPLNTWFSWIGRVVLFLMMLLTVTDVVGRKFVGIIPGMRPVSGAFEITEFMMVVVVFTAVAFALTKDDHIAIDVLTTRFSKRVQAILDFFVYLLSLAISILMVRQAIIYAIRMLEQGDISGVLKIPIYPFLILVAVGMILFSLALAVRLIQSLSKSLQKAAK